MLKRTLIFVALAAALLAASGCSNRKVQNPIANIDSKQPDKVLFDRAMDSMKTAKYPVARTLLETMINTYPDSEFIARAKLAVVDSWYAEGGTAGLQQAEAQYKDFITFFPNLPEAAEDQLKVANIHYKQMEKPDRDFAQALRAEDEYRSLMQQFPDSKLLPEAKQRLREVQEVLAERQFSIAGFYAVKENMAAAQARLKSLVDSYPLFSQADEALFLLGNIYEKEAAALRRQKIPDSAKERLVAEFEKNAIDAYSRIITRYPAMGRVDDAKRRLADMKAPVPTPTAEALAQNQAEEDSRQAASRFNQVVMTFKKHPDVSKTAKVGEPSMEDAQIASAPAMLQHVDKEIKGASAPGTEKAALETVRAGTGAAPANQPAPGSQPTPGTAANATAGNSTPANATTGAADPPPQQVNDLQSGDSPDKDKQSQDTNSKDDSTSQKKGKKGLRKLIPF